MRRPPDAGKENNVPHLRPTGRTRFHMPRLAQRGITQPFDIQAAAMADALDGRDICGRAPTGSGKTLAFGIPLVVNVGRARPHRPRAARARSH